MEEPEPFVTGKPWLQGWRKKGLLAALLLVSIFSQIDRILPFILAESIKLDLHLSDTELGLIMGVAFSACYSLASLPLARLADNGWGRRTLLVCVLLWSAMTSLGGLASGFVSLALSRLGVALGEAGGTPASHALIAQRIAPQARGRAIGLFTMGIPLGTMLGFAIGGRASDTIGWRNALFLAGAFGLVIAILIVLLIGKTGEIRQHARNNESFFSSSKALFSKPQFVWMFAAANLLGFASAPFYAFGAPFLMRAHGLTASQVGISFGLLQGLMGIIGTLLGGRIFDSAVNRRSGRLLDPPAITLCIAAFTTLLALFTPVTWVSIALFVPGMFSFAFLLPHAFGAGHLIAGPGKQALASALLMLGSGLLPAALSPLLVGMISDAATSANHKNGLQLGMMVIPVFSLLSGIVCFKISRQLKTHFKTTT
jgi:predicted MFS family arabinose efflux permease